MLLKALLHIPALHMNVMKSGVNSTRMENDSELLRAKQILDLFSVFLRVHRCNAAHCCCCWFWCFSQFESTSQASHTVGHSIISASTFTDEKKES